jgi:4-amino-4-deoxy-L-arabinose transferase-like glycosyltransferase
MPVPERTPSAHGGLRVGGELRRDTSRTLVAAGDRVVTALRVDLAGCSGYAWAAAGVVATFVALTCWWLTQDRSIPIYDAGDHLEAAIEYHGMLANGNLLEPFTQTSIYPILGHIVGALAMFVGGVGVASPIVGENLVFVPLLALGCYQTGRLLFGRLAGMLAVVFVLGSPLLIAQFHVFMLDAPLTALVAVSIWLVLASDHFSRRRAAGLAGLAVGLGLNMKAQYPLFLAGLVLIVLLNGGWRNWRGFGIFCIVAVVVGAPWYIFHFSELGTLLELGGRTADAAPANLPPMFSTANLTWYFWSVVNSQLLVPLFILVAAGALWMIVMAVRNRREQMLRLEFLAGTFLAWLAITLTPHHDIRYGMPLLAFLAIIGTGWIARLPRAPRTAAISLLALGVIGNTLGIDFGVGREISVGLPPVLASTAGTTEAVLYTTNGFLVSAPSRDGDVPGLLEALHREGVRTVTWSLGESQAPDFSFEGLLPLVRIAKLSPAITRTPEFSASSTVATLVHQEVTANAPPTCTRLSDGTGVWVVRYESVARKDELYCPTRSPRYYDPGVT